MWRYIIFTLAVGVPAMKQGRSDIKDYLEGRPFERPKLLFGTGADRVKFSWDKLKVNGVMQQTIKKTGKTYRPCERLENGYYRISMAKDVTNYVTSQNDELLMEEKDDFTHPTKWKIYTLEKNEHGVHPMIIQSDSGQNKVVGGYAASGYTPKLTIHPQQYREFLPWCDENNNVYLQVMGTHYWVEAYSDGTLRYGRYVQIFFQEQTPFKFDPVDEFDSASSEKKRPGWVTSSDEIPEFKSLRVGAPKEEEVPPKKEVILPEGIMSEERLHYVLEDLEYELLHSVELDRHPEEKEKKIKRRDELKAFLIPPTLEDANAEVERLKDIQADLSKISNPSKEQKKALAETELRLFGITLPPDSEDRGILTKIMQTIGQKLDFIAYYAEQGDTSHDIPNDENKEKLLAVNKQYKTLGEFVQYWNVFGTNPPPVHVKIRDEEGNHILAPVDIPDYFMA